jgi:glycosyltransferase involved in cell wall biosynthesis
MINCTPVLLRCKEEWYHVIMPKKKKHIVIDARIRQASTGRPIARLLEHLQEIDSDHRYTILVKKDDNWKPTNKNYSVKQIRYPIFSFNPINQLLYAIDLYRLKPDLTYFTLTPSQPLFFFKKYITFTHDLVMFSFARAGRLPEWLHKIRMQGYRFLMWQAHRMAKAITVPTEYVKDDVHKRYLFTSRKLHVTLESSEPPLPGRAKSPENDPGEFIMYTGSAFPHKNLDRLVSAFGLLKEHHPGLKLVFVGKIEYHAKQLQKFVKKQTYKDDIIFANENGFVEDETLKWYLQNARAYVFPSLNEGFGLTGLEAMVHGCPVVSSNTTTLPEVHGDAAHYFDPTDIHDMAAKIDEVISSDPLRKKLIVKGYENAKRFSWRRYTQQNLALFKELLKEN